MTLTNAIDDVNAITGTNPETTIQVVDVDSSGCTIMFNLEMETFQDERIRQAMMLAHGLR
ncbi:MAG: hypothetical protein O2895_02745 [Chloroflexi bacterium]|nr:hypothetical protein [Chloroflexota bacterium]